LTAQTQQSPRGIDPTAWVLMAEVLEEARINGIQLTASFLAVLLDVSNSTAGDYIKILWEFLPTTGCWRKDVVGGYGSGVAGRSKRVVVPIPDAAPYVAPPPPEKRQRPVKPPRPGFFYVVQLVPDLDPGRIKLGWASHVNNRVDGYRTACPDMEVLGYWVCNQADELAAIKYISSVATRRVSREVFDFVDPQDTIDRAMEHFGGH
jgi:hypothetical protein